MEAVIKQGDTYIKRVYLYYAGTKNPINLTGYTAHCQLRNYPGGTLIAEAETSVVPESGCVSIAFSKDQTAGFEPGKYGYDIRIESANGRKTIFTEQVTVVKPYTELESGSDNYDDYE